MNEFLRMPPRVPIPTLGKIQVNACPQAYDITVRAR